MEPVRFVTEDGVHLEGELRLPDGPPRATAVLCHPHPRHGGSKDHPILWAIRNELAHRGYAVLGFNFRGVMGRDELRDVRAAIDRVRSVDERAPTLLGGWSFGASVALREALDDGRSGALALVGIPLRPGDVQLPALPAPAELRTLTRPVLFLTGDGDGFCPPEELRTYARPLRSASIAIVEGTDHYLWRREREAADIIGSFADGALALG
jgi:uncharacterized protein